MSERALDPNEPMTRTTALALIEDTHRWQKAYEQARNEIAGLETLLDKDERTKDRLREAGERFLDWWFETEIKDDELDSIAAEFMAGVGTKLVPPTGTESA